MTDAALIKKLAMQLDSALAERELFNWLLRLPAVDAQAYFWNYSSRTERRKAMLADMRKDSHD